MEKKSLLSYLKKAKKEKWAVPHFNVHTLDNARACVEAAYELKSPIVIAFTPGSVNFSGFYSLLGVVSGLQKQYPSIPIFFHMDHYHSVDKIIDGIKAGVKSVMIDNSLLSYEKNVSNTKKVVNEARKAGNVVVEAELGLIPGVEDDLIIHPSEHKAQYTSPLVVLDFIKKTGIDSLAVAIGNAHGIYLKKPKLKINTLKDINAVTQIPLVLHGGSGLTDEQIRNCIKNGVAKVNIATELKPYFVKALRKFFSENEKEYDPRKYLAPAINAVKEVAMAKIKICQSNNKI